MEDFLIIQSMRTSVVCMKCSAIINRTSSVEYLFVLHYIVVLKQMGIGRFSVIQFRVR